MVLSVAMGCLPTPLVAHKWADRHRGEMDRFFSKTFEFFDTIGVGPILSLILAAIAEFIAPILEWKPRLEYLFPSITMLLAFFIIHDGDPFSRKEKAFVCLIVFLVYILIAQGSTL